MSFLRVLCGVNARTIRKIHGVVSSSDDFEDESGRNVQYLISDEDLIANAVRLNGFESAGVPFSLLSHPSEKPTQTEKKKRKVKPIKENNFKIVDNQDSKLDKSCLILDESYDARLKDFGVLKNSLRIRNDPTGCNEENITKDLSPTNSTSIGHFFTEDLDTSYLQPKHTSKISIHSILLTENEEIKNEMDNRCVSLSTKTIQKKKKNGKMAKVMEDGRNEMNQQYPIYGGWNEENVTEDFLLNNGFLSVIEEGTSFLQPKRSDKISTHWKLRTKTDDIKTSNSFLALKVKEDDESPTLVENEETENVVKNRFVTLSSKTTKKKKKKGNAVNVIIENKLEGGRNEMNQQCPISGESDVANDLRADSSKLHHNEESTLFLQPKRQSKISTHSKLRSGTKDIKTSNSFLVLQTQEDVESSTLAENEETENDVKNRFVSLSSKTTGKNKKKEKIVDVIIERNSGDGRNEMNQQYPLSDESDVANDFRANSSKLHYNEESVTQNFLLNAGFVPVIEDLGTSFLQPKRQSKISTHSKLRSGTKYIKTSNSFSVLQTKKDVENAILAENEETENDVKNKFVTLSSKTTTKKKKKGKMVNVIIKNNSEGIRNEMNQQYLLSSEPDVANDLRANSSELNYNEENITEDLSLNAGFFPIIEDLGTSFLQPKHLSKISTHSKLPTETKHIKPPNSCLVLQAKEDVQSHTRAENEVKNRFVTLSSKTTEKKKKTWNMVNVIIENKSEDCRNEMNQQYPISGESDVVNGLRADSSKLHHNEESVTEDCSLNVIETLGTSFLQPKFQSKISTHSKLRTGTKDIQTSNSFLALQSKEDVENAILAENEETENDVKNSFVTLPSKPTEKKKKRGKEVNVIIEDNSENGRNEINQQYSLSGKSDVANGLRENSSKLRYNEESITKNFSLNAGFFPAVEGLGTLFLQPKRPSKISTHSKLRTDVNTSNSYLVLQDKEDADSAILVESVETKNDMKNTFATPSLKAIQKKKKKKIVNDNSKDGKKEMDQKYPLLDESNVVNISSYNSNLLYNEERVSFREDLGTLLLHVKCDNDNTKLNEEELEGPFLEPKRSRKVSFSKLNGGKKDIETSNFFSVFQDNEDVESSSVGERAKPILENNVRRDFVSLSSNEIQRKKKTLGNKNSEDSLFKTVCHLPSEKVQTFLKLHDWDYHSDSSDCGKSELDDQYEANRPPPISNKQLVNNVVRLNGRAI